MEREITNRRDRIDREGEVERVDTAFRMLDSIFFAIVFSVVEWVVALLVVFQLGYSLVTERIPSSRVQDLGNRLSTYAYQIIRYLTHNTAERPFPFSDFPPALEVPEAPYPTHSVSAADDSEDYGAEDDRDDFESMPEVGPR